MEATTLAFNMAVKRLIHRRRQLILSVAGVCFATLLICMQLGFVNALFDAQVQVVDALAGDLFVLSKGKYTLVTARPFPARRIVQAGAVPGVQRTSSVLIEYEASVWRHPEGSVRRAMRVFGVVPGDGVFRDERIREQMDRLRLPDTLLVDELSREEYGIGTSPGVATELGRRSVVVVGTFRLGTDFVNDANAITSQRNFLKLFPHQRSADPDLGRVELGVIELDGSRDPSEVQADLELRLPDDVHILTRGQLRGRELAFWRANTPIGAIFILAAGMGFLIGMVICYQILFTDVIEQLPQFGTLLAMGFARGRVVSIVLAQALVVALVSALPALAIARLIYWLVADLTGLPMELGAGRSSLVVVIAIVMCTASGLLAVRRALRIDPAELFA